MKKFGLVITSMIIAFSIITVNAQSQINMLGFLERDLTKNSTGLKNLDISIKKLEIQYKDSQNDAKQAALTMDDYGKYLNNYGKMGLNLVNELVPESMGKAVESLTNTKKTTQNQLIIGLREYYRGFLASYLDMNLKEEKYNLEAVKHSQNKTRYENGLIDENALSESEYNLESKKTEYIISQRNMENIARSLENYVGISIGDKYGNFIYIEDENDFFLEDVQTYIDLALENNAELLDIKNQIELKQLEIEILERNNAYKGMEEGIKNHRDALRALERLQVDLEDKKYEVENNIKNAYIDFMKEKDNIESIKKSLSSLNTKLDKVEAQYQQGMVTKTIVDELKLGVTELENGLKLSVFGYNTKLIKLKYAIGLGPQY